MNNVSSNFYASLLIVIYPIFLYFFVYPHSQILLFIHIYNPKCETMDKNE